MLDFSNEQEQHEFVSGPVPGGSIVMLEMEVLQPSNGRQARENPYISVAQKGIALRQIYCQFTVTHGSYQGVSFRQNITLPLGAQTINLPQSYQKACCIGGSTLKAICLSAGKPPKIQDVTSLTGLRFPAKLKINQRPMGKDGRTYWNNELALVITPDREDYQSVRNGGEIIITNGPTSGKGSTDAGIDQTRSEAGQEQVPGWDVPPTDSYNDFPF